MEEIRSSWSEKNTDWMLGDRTQGILEFLLCYGKFAIYTREKHSKLFSKFVFQ